MRRRGAGRDDLVDHERRATSPSRPPRPRSRRPAPEPTSSTWASWSPVDGLLDGAHHLRRRTPCGRRRRGAAGGRCRRGRAGRRCSGRAPIRRTSTLAGDWRERRHQLLDACAGALVARPRRRAGTGAGRHEAAGHVAQRGPEVGVERSTPIARSPPRAARRPVSPARTPAVSSDRICSPSSSPPPPLVTWSISSGLFSASSLRYAATPSRSSASVSIRPAETIGAAEGDLGREVADRAAGDRAEGLVRRDLELVDPAVGQHRGAHHQRVGVELDRAGQQAVLAGGRGADVVLGLGVGRLRQVGRTRRPPRRGGPPRRVARASASRRRTGRRGRPAAASGRTCPGGRRPRWRAGTRRLAGGQLFRSESLGHAVTSASTGASSVARSAGSTRRTCTRCGRRRGVGRSACQPSASSVHDTTPTTVSRRRRRRRPGPAAGPATRCESASSTAADVELGRAARRRRRATSPACWPTSTGDQVDATAAQPPRRRRRRARTAGRRTPGPWRRAAGRSSGSTADPAQLGGPLARCGTRPARRRSPSTVERVATASPDWRCQAGRGRHRRRRRCRRRSGGGEQADGADQAGAVAVVGRAGRAARATSPGRAASRAPRRTPRPRPARLSPSRPSSASRRRRRLGDVERQRCAAGALGDEPQLGQGQRDPARQRVEERRWGAAAGCRDRWSACQRPGRLTVSQSL